MSREKTIDALLGTLSVEEKAAQLMVLGYTGVSIDPEFMEFIEKYGLGGLRLSPVLARKFIRYLPDGSPGIENVVRPPSPREKLFNESIPPRHVTAEEYATILNEVRGRIFDRNGVPIHTVVDCESGGGCNFVPYGFITTPAPMGFGHLGDTDLIYRSSVVIAKQLKCMGIDMLHSPVVDVNTNPNNPEIYTRSYHENQDKVIECARAALKGYKDGGAIACLKHYPGRGAAAQDAHFGISAMDLERGEMEAVHLKPYKVLCSENVVPAVMPAHSIYPALDESSEIATVSSKIITNILREEYGYDGIITTDSMTMGGLMAKYSVGEACVRAFEAGVDLLLLKDDNSLRFEMHDSLVRSIKSGRISEERLNQSLRRILSMKWDYGLFDNGGKVDTDAIKNELRNKAHIQTGLESCRKVIRLKRDSDNLLPLDKDQKILVIDRITQNQLLHNDSWNYPGMLWDFMLRESKNVSYVDYTPDTMDRAGNLAEQLIPSIDIIVVTAHFNRGEENNSKDFIRGLKRFEKPIVLVSSNPYEELVIPKEIGTVVVCYGLMRQNLEAVSEFLFNCGSE